MTSLCVSRGHLLESCFWSSETFCDVLAIRRDDQGDPITSSIGAPLHIQYTQEISTGDLYRRVDDRFHLALKCGGISLATLFYAPGLVLVNFLKIVIDLSSFFWRVLPSFIQNLSTKGIVRATANLLMATLWQIPTAISEDIWRIARVPIYALGMISAGLVGLIAPMEGLRWIAKIEFAWHQKTSYQMDLRHRKTDKELCSLRNIPNLITEICSGKILFLGYCIQKRGNIEDEVAGMKRFELLKKNNNRR